MQNKPLLFDHQSRPANLDFHAIVNSVRQTVCNELDEKGWACIIGLAAPDPKDPSTVHSAIGLNQLGYKNLPMARHMLQNLLSKIDAEIAKQQANEPQPDTPGESEQPS